MRVSGRTAISNDNLDTLEITHSLMVAQMSGFLHF